jgi:hypothetical protein
MLTMGAGTPALLTRQSMRPNQRLAFCLPACRDNDLGPFLDKNLDDSFADAARAAGDDGDFPVQSAHSLPPSHFRS